jgi:succinate dehydrogenase / fumarate reductase flavoprotein subunit
VVSEKYGNLFEMYDKIVGENPYKNPMMIYPAIHYTMGGLWVDYNLETNIPGLFALGECNFSDHGANRLGASALMQGLADGYFILPYTIGAFLSKEIRTPNIKTDYSGVYPGRRRRLKSEINHLLQVKGGQSVESLHRQFGQDYVGSMWNGQNQRRP